MLFHEGDCYDAFLVEESGRILRGYNFLARADVFAVDQPDGSKHVVVDTQDEWTTRVDLGLSFDSRIQVEGLEVSEENLAGRGIHTSVFFRQRKERKDVGGRLELPRLFGSRTNFAVSAGRTRNGTFVDEQVAYPFVGEVGRLAVRQSYSRRDELFPYVVSRPEVSYSHVLLPNFDERAEISVAGRLGHPGNLTLLGIGISRETLDFEGFPGSLEVAHESDFSNTEPAPSEAGALVGIQTHPASTTRIDFFIGQRNLRFARVRGLDPLAGVQDIQLGTDAGLTLARSVDVLTAQGLATADDLYGRFRFFAGFDPGTSYVFLNLAADARNIISGERRQGRVARHHRRGRPVRLHPRTRPVRTHVLRPGLGSRRVVHDHALPAHPGRDDRRCAACRRRTSPEPAGFSSPWRTATSCPGPHPPSSTSGSRPSPRRVGCGRETCRTA